MGEVRVVERDGRLALSDGAITVAADFADDLARLQPARLAHEMLVKAARLKGLGRPVHVMDCTAGLGEDSLLLAAAGCEVVMWERNPLTARVLADGLRRACLDSRLADAAGRMALVNGDSLRALERHGTDGSFEADVLFGHVEAGWVPDVVYLDPMFPAKRKDALAKKKLQVLQSMEAPCGQGEELLEAARGCGCWRVVVKRPAKGPWLGGAKPSRSVCGKTVRYDVYECVRPAGAE